MKPVHVGFGGIIAANRILAILDPESQPIKRMMRRAKKSGTAIDVTYGRRARSIIVLDTSHIVMSAIQPQTIVDRLKKGEA